MPPLAASNHAKEVEETLDRYPVGVLGEVALHYVA
jgi:hypothetical protein